MNYCLIKFVLIQAFNQIYSTIVGKFIEHSTIIFPHTFTLIDNYVTQNNIKMYQQGYENFPQFNTARNKLNCMTARNPIFLSYLT